MVGRQYRHQCVAVLSFLNMECGKRDSGCGISSERFDEHSLARIPRELFSDRCILLRVGHRPEAVSGNNRMQPRHSLLEHRALTNDV